MGKIKKGVFGEFTGKVGNLVGCTWKGIPYMRTRPANMTNPRTEKQQGQRSKFRWHSTSSEQLLPFYASDTGNSQKDRLLSTLPCPM